MGGEKGEACEIPEKRNEKDVLTYFSRVVLFHITGFYQWLVNSSVSSFLMTDKHQSGVSKDTAYVPWKPHIEKLR